MLLGYGYIFAIEMLSSVFQVQTRQFTVRMMTLIKSQKKDRRCGTVFCLELSSVGKAKQKADGLSSETLRFQLRDFVYD